MTITISKVLPTSSWYSGSGATTITLSGLNSMTIHSKKDLIKIKILKSNDTSSDKGMTWIKDLKNIDFEMKLRGWLVDTTASSAWTQAWKLRAMCTSQGPIASLIIEDKTFTSSTQQVYLEDINIIAHPNRTQGLRINETSSKSLGVARIEADLSLYAGDQR
ncbi:MAG: hypothetical protein IMZ51_04040 [Chloroflexi bacterium]|nr:hypothetical protein [Chloroflexota bacterium]